MDAHQSLAALVPSLPERANEAADELEKILRTLGPGHILEARGRQLLTFLRGTRPDCRGEVLAWLRAFQGPEPCRPLPGSPPPRPLP